MFRAVPDSSQIDLLSNVEQLLSPRPLEKLSDACAWHNVFLATRRCSAPHFPRCAWRSRSSWRPAISVIMKDAATTGVIADARGRDSAQLLPGDGRSFFAGIDWRL
jgi:hypothetical protein